MASRIYSVLAVVTDTQGCYLAVSRKEDHDDLGFPGGDLGPGESSEDALVRQLHEATGLVVSRRSLRSAFVHPDQEGRLCMAFDVLQYKGIAYSREGAWVGWVRPARFLDSRSTSRDLNQVVFEHKGVIIEPLITVERALPADSPPRPAPRQPVQSGRAVEDALLELTGINGFPQQHITFLYGPAALSFCPRATLAQPRVTFDQKVFSGLLSEPVLVIRAHQHRSLVPSNLLRYLHSLGSRCVSAVVAVSPHRPSEDWGAASSNVIECQRQQTALKLTLTKNRAATAKPIGTSVVVPTSEPVVVSHSLHQPRP